MYFEQSIVTSRKTFNTTTSLILVHSCTFKNGHASFRTRPNAAQKYQMTLHRLDNQLHLQHDDPISFHTFACVWVILEK